MVSSEYIIEKLKELVKDFPAIKVRYEYKGDSSVHFVEVLPGSVYRHDEGYADAEDRIIMDFIKEFPDENICFVTEDSYVTVENPSFELVGCNYVEPFSILRNAPVSILMGKCSICQDQVLNRAVSITPELPLQVDADPIYSVDYSLHYTPLAA